MDTSDGNAKKNAKRTYIAIALVLLISIISIFTYFVLNRSKSSDDPGPIRVLLIGNNLLYLNDIPDTLRQVSVMSIAARPLEVTCLARPEFSLADHLKAVPDEEYTSTARTLLDGSQDWDFVVLQDRCLEPIEDPALMHDSIKELAKLARKKGARVTLFMTWADQGDEQRQSVLSAVSRKLADRLSIEVAPCGDLFFDVANKHKTLNPYDADHHNASALGAWIAASSVYSVVSGQKPKLIPDKFTYNSGDGAKPHLQVDAAQATDLGTMVWEKVNAENRTHKLGPNTENVMSTRGIPIPQQH